MLEPWLTAGAELLVNPKKVPDLRNVLLRGDRECEENGKNGGGHFMHTLGFSCYRFRPIANKLADERTYNTPSDSAGVAINNSPIEFVARWLNFSPAAMINISPSSFER